MKNFLLIYGISQEIAKSQFPYLTARNVRDLILKYESVDLVIKAIDYSKKKAIPLDHACEILYKSQALS